MSYKEGDWFVYCDICGQRQYASSTNKLSTYTGRGGLIVCRHDQDRIDEGLKPSIPRKEQSVPWVRIIHTSTLDASPIFDYETDTVENISSYQYLAPSQYDDTVLVLSQNEDIWLATSQEL